MEDGERSRKKEDEAGRMGTGQHVFVVAGFASEMGAKF
jgi:hypothetical protein